MLRAVIKGYEDRILDNQIIAVQAGYWSAYYMGSKHPKPTHKIAEDMLNKHNQKDASKISRPKPEVDVNSFLEREAQFKARLEQQGR